MTRMSDAEKRRTGPAKPADEWGATAKLPKSPLGLSSSGLWPRDGSN